ncbi:hypothetical protein SEA_HEXBUG_33 [Gordonia phage Hexbug]|nr:hypothetical protein SEA_ORLA_33 [Gordonia phage Orla]UVK62947.1 hypothetical protein SEA_HEXBUG_33 [Gordonia phage Hexbug]WNN96124.1 hypothetical protein SEA_NODIGI_33 [Gordonia phage Nodigi]
MSDEVQKASRVAVEQLELFAQSPAVQDAPVQADPREDDK